MHLQRIIIDNKLARDFIDTVLLSIYSHVIELVSIDLVALSATNELVSIATAKFVTLLSVTYYISRCIDLTSFYWQLMHIMMCMHKC